jgi:hypothetical protein
MLFKKRNDPNSPVQIAVAPNEIVAKIWENVLKDNGIPCFLKSINLVESMYTAPITLQFKVMVMPSNLEKAKELLAPFLEDSGTDEDGREKQQ